MKKFIMGVIVGGAVSLSTVAAASDSIQAFLFPAFFTINDQSVDMDKESPILNYNGQAYVPVRFMAEQLGAYVDYNEESKQIIVNYFPSNKSVLTDSKYTNVHFSLIDVYLDGGYTGVRGLLSIDKIKEAAVETEHDIEFSLNFYDSNDKLLGKALGSSLPRSSADKQTIRTGEIKTVGAGEVGDFSNYSKVTFEVTRYK
ncbi:copper amine oxidase N-terminal domain-containing protein [Paenibacillus sp. HWE-109]|uniref:stalk domain-containing protein n=1 Tax=Paenibacillus sp. HWE-109 TaxID=1306526 RepID=UPI001EDDB34C|nr:stalk domain-containing protein [Paenibacillus sp. HWE-109]UKS23941.1 copper amine oxidase N-terminal domain-containing protein [Paenibacillus sp. HWE-109]